MCGSGHGVARSSLAIAVVGHLGQLAEVLCVVAGQVLPLAELKGLLIVVLLTFHLRQRF